MEEKVWRRRYGGEGMEEKGWRRRGVEEKGWRGRDGEVEGEGVRGEEVESVRGWRGEWCLTATKCKCHSPSQVVKERKSTKLAASLNESNKNTCSGSGSLAMNLSSGR